MGFVNFLGLGGWRCVERGRPAWCCVSGEDVSGGVVKTPGGEGRRRKRVGVPKGVGFQRAWYSPTLTEGSLEGGSRDLAEKSALVVLGVETSCDDTAAAVVRGDGVILGEAIVSQSEIHQEWGGIVPNLAMEAHMSAVDGVIAEALENAGMTEEDLDAVAVTMGPGLEICLRVGFNAVKTICERSRIPFVAVNHLEGHSLLAKMFNPNLKFPFLVLLVSGGHCQLLVAKGAGRYELLGGTLDDAIGEAYDKTARLLGLQVGGGGGPAVEKLAENGNDMAHSFPVPMRQRKDCNFSYAGLKNAVRLTVQSENERFVPEDVAASFQRAAIQHLIDRVRRAMDYCVENSTEDKIDSIVVCGGVASNRILRRRLDELVAEYNWELVLPPPRLCTDNGVMIAWAGIERIRNGILDDPTKLEVVSRWPLSISLSFK